jgi:hypothetical protein
MSFPVFPVFVPGRMIVETDRQQVLHVFQGYKKFKKPDSIKTIRAVDKTEK